ncbi:protein deadlock-like [Drosophila madeirensis]|uniref:Protein deadlock-like n=1 Tax=Drosophila madeirensis TaxID=30013 RepID=A0AAU9G0L8_DROMD
MSDFLSDLFLRMGDCLVIRLEDSDTDFDSDAMDVSEDEDDQIPELARQPSVEAGPAPATVPAEANEPIAAPPLPGHQVPERYEHGWDPMPIQPALVDLRREELNAETDAAVFPEHVLESNSAFSFTSNALSSMNALFGVKCTDNINGGCTKPNCDHSLESAESVKTQLMLMPSEEVLNIYHQVFHHGFLLDKYHHVFLDVFRLRGFGNTYARLETDTGDYL